MDRNLEKISQSIWELRKRAGENPARFYMRRDLLKYFHEAKISYEKEQGVAGEDRSFLLLQRLNDHPVAQWLDIQTHLVTSYFNC